MEEPIEFLLHESLSSDWVDDANTPHSKSFCILLLEASRRLEESSRALCYLQEMLILLSFPFQPFPETSSKRLSSLTLATFSNAPFQTKKSTLGILSPICCYSPCRRTLSGSFPLSFYLNTFYSPFEAGLYSHFFSKVSLYYSAPLSFLLPVNFNPDYYHYWTLSPSWHWCCERTFCLGPANIHNIS